MIFDLIFLTILVWAAYRGFSKGLVLQAATLAALILGIFGAVRFSGFTSNLIISHTSINGQYMHLISFALTFAIISPFIKMYLSVNLLLS